jgi:hypothetical protein
MTVWVVSESGSYTVRKETPASYPSRSPPNRWHAARSRGRNDYLPREHRFRAATPPLALLDQGPRHRVAQSTADGRRRPSCMRPHRRCPVLEDEGRCCGDPGRRGSPRRSAQDAASDRRYAVSSKLAGSQTRCCTRSTNLIPLARSARRAKTTSLRCCKRSVRLAGSTGGVHRALSDSRSSRPRCAPAQPAHRSSTWYASFSSR